MEREEEEHQAGTQVEAIVGALKKSLWLPIIVEVAVMLKKMKKL